MVLSLVVALFDLVPLVGATLAGIILVIVAFFVSPIKALILIVYFIVYQQVESNVLQPLIYGRSVDLPPLVIFLAVLAGGELMGILGALIAIPIAEIIRIIGAEWLTSRRGQTATPATPATPVTPPDLPAPPVVRAGVEG